MFARTNGSNIALRGETLDQTFSGVGCNQSPLYFRAKR